MGNMEEMHKTKARDYPPSKYCDPNWVIEDSFIVAVMEKCDGIWMHNGDFANAHAELTSGKCSNGFFNCLKALKYINLNEIFAYHLAARIRQEIGDMPVDWVIGSPMAGITFSYAVARYLGAGIQMFTEKDSEVKGRMLWKREVIPEGDSVLQIEELITTSQTLNEVQNAIERDNPHPVNWIPLIGVFVHRPSKLPVAHYGGRKLVSLFEREIWAVEPPCKLCENGSVRYRPKTNWRELTGK
jgi:orotate phosphoribosyltransferase